MSTIRGERAETMGAFTASDCMRVDGTLADGRIGQSPLKNQLLLDFARRVVDGDAKPHETAYMCALMAADIPASGTMALGGE